MNYLFGLMSALIGLLLINGVVLTNSTAWRSPMAGLFPLEVRYLLGYAIAFLFVLIANQWAPGYLVFFVFTFVAIIFGFFAARRLSAEDWRNLLVDGLSIFIVQIVLIFYVFYVFKVAQFWLLEALNHDSLIYHYGSLWSAESKLFVGSEVVHAKWGPGAWVIGYDKPLYRGGTYTLEAWIRYFAPRSSGNSLYYILAYGGTLGWLSVRLFFKKGVRGWRSAITLTLMAVLVSLSTAFVGALVNSNMATVMGAASLCLIFALTLRSDLPAHMRYAAMAAWCAVGTHFYAESIFYAGLLVFFVFAFELKAIVRASGWAGATRLGLGVLAIVVVLGNVAFAQSISSLFLFSTIAKGGEWTSWYIHQTPLVWAGSFVAGLLLGETPSQSMVWLSAVTTIFALLILLRTREHRCAALALALVSCLAVTYVLVNSYQYGEHKILHLLGGAWSLSIVAAFISLTGADRKLVFGRMLHGKRRFMGVVLLACLAFETIHFSVKADKFLERMPGVHSLDFGVSEFGALVRTGETVLLNDAEWAGAEKFLKTHYLAFELSRQGAKVLLPTLDGDTLRGGYFRSALNNTFQREAEVNWLISSIGHSAINEKFGGDYGPPVWQNKDFRLYRVHKKPVVVAAGGFYDCEPSHCWTRGAFELEVFVPAASTYQLAIDFWPLVPTKSDLLTVRGNGRRELAKVNGGDNKISISVPAGWSRLTFEPAVPVVSPQELGMSADERKLFVALRHVEIAEIKAGD